MGDPFIRTFYSTLTNAYCILTIALDIMGDGEEESEPYVSPQ